MPQAALSEVRKHFPVRRIHGLIEIRVSDRWHPIRVGRSHYSLVLCQADRPHADRLMKIFRQHGLTLKIPFIPKRHAVHV